MTGLNRIAIAARWFGLCSQSKYPGLTSGNRIAIAAPCNDQQQLNRVERLVTARAIVQAKLKNSRVLLLRQKRRRESELLGRVVDSLEYLALQAKEADSWERLMGFEGAGAAQYFSALAECLTNSEWLSRT